MLELELPTVLAVNMLDVAESRGIRIDLDRLERRLGIPVVPIQANRRIGLPQLKAALAGVIGRQRRGRRRGDGETRRRGDRHAPQCPAADSPPSPRLPHLPLSIPRCPTPSRRKRPRSTPNCPAGCPRWLVRRLLLDAGGYLQQTLLDDADGHWAGRIEAARARLAAAGCPTPAVETSARYGWAREILDGVVTEPSRSKTTATDQIDRVLTHRLWGTLVFAVVMLVMFQSVFVWARPAMRVAFKRLTAAAGDWVSARMAEGALRSLLVDGVIGGVGAVFAFLPQILILFAFLAVLEDCGYMARTAYLMDRLMVRVGLSGKSFIPLLSSFACAVPGVMATRVIENERDRLTTILVAPLLTCSARLPVYALLIAAIIPDYTYLIVKTEHVRRRRLADVARIDACRTVPARHRRGRGRGPGVQADDPARADAAVRDGVAQLQVAVAADGVLPHGRSRLGVPAMRRHADSGGVDPGLGRPLFSAQSAGLAPAATARQLPRPGRPRDRAGR